VRSKVSTVSLVAGESTVTFERRSVHVDHRPDRGGCGPDAARQAAAHKPCDQQVVVRGIRIAMLPPPP
jgi:hypothetical protein